MNDASPNLTTQKKVCALLLAGGAGTRMNGQDKGLLHWRERPMAHWVAEALSTVATPVLISANRSLEEYRLLGDVLQDSPDFKNQGPLAGLLSGMTEARKRGFDAVLVCPCDTPGIQPDVFQRLLTAWQQNPDLPVIAECDGRAHPLHGVYPVSLVGLLEAQLRGDNRRVMVFAETAGVKTLDCPDAAEAFKNKNRPEDLVS
ncbi:MAG TPA: molybdenum cofactor guanylyltransferase [Marinobacter sp.]|uniref:Molybdenum cofactor guanylyltransferase n=2 Tax=root TaxID=1 RepID=A0A831VYU7_9GAMM|nr:molybdenum cofactor guanylyltransferase MobA [Marinobacter antarcticus]HDZ37981.1 molybdenum cofactor guanylyltransferase [Marinobacter sp.]HEA53011.1 molybdenum cofactor guanylyltransferase [Marinobacter antarcticus]